MLPKLMIEKLLIFDLDGTIINVFGCGRAAIDKTIERMFGIKGAGKSLDFYSSTDYGAFLNLINKLNLKDIFYSRIVEFSSIYSEELNKEIKNNESSCLLPGFPELLDHLRKNKSNYLVLATGNLKVGAKTKMAYFGLDEYFPVGGFGDLLINKKEVIFESFKNAELFYKRKFKREHVFVIGDTIQDINAAKELGFTSIAVLTGLGKRESLISSKADYILEELTNLEQFDKVIDRRNGNFNRLD